MHLLTFALALTTAALPCSTPAHRAFDFWAGDWDGYDVGAEQVKAARVTVEIALDGCALYEVYEGTNGLVGRSLSAYDAGRGAWHQTWVTNRGQLLELAIAGPLGAAGTLSIRRLNIFEAKGEAGGCPG